MLMIAILANTVIGGGQWVMSDGQTTTAILPIAHHPSLIAEMK
jgi:hypothetical protein